MADEDLRLYPHMIPRRGSDGKLAGDFQCSLCKTMFSPECDLIREFYAHVRLAHSNKRRPRIDVSQKGMG
jgi:hypothetical protein